MLILNERVSEHMGSVWDSKLWKDTGLTLYEIRFKAAMMVVDSGWTYREVRELIGVSDGFIRKWSRYFRAYREEKKIKINAKVQIKTKFMSVSNRPKHCPCPVRDRIRQAVLDRHKKYGFEGAVRIKYGADIDASPTTITKVLREEGVIGKPKRRHANLCTGRFERPFPNDLWHTDFKEWRFKFGTIKTAWITDDASRFIAGFYVGEHSSADAVVEMFESAVGRFGKPKQIITDHGSEFHSIRGGKGRSKLDVWCKANGVEHIMGKVRHPQTNGKAERTHRSAKEELPYFGEVNSLDDMKKAVSEWIVYHNNEGAHSSLGNRVPAAVYFSFTGLEDLIESCMGEDTA